MNRNQVTRDNESATSRRMSMIVALAAIAMLCSLFSTCEAQAWDTVHPVLMDTAHYEPSLDTLNMDSILFQYSSPGKLIRYDPKSSMISVQPFDITAYHGIDGEWEMSITATKTAYYSKLI